MVFRAPSSKYLNVCKLNEKTLFIVEAKNTNNPMCLNIIANIDLLMFLANDLVVIITYLYLTVVCVQQILTHIILHTSLQGADA